MPVDNSQQFGGSAAAGDTQMLANFLSSLYRRDLVMKPEIFAIGKSIDTHLLSVIEYGKKINLTSDADYATIFIGSLDEAVKNILYFEADFEDKKADFGWI